MPDMKISLPSGALLLRDPLPTSLRGVDRDIPMTYEEVPAGHRVGGATMAQLRAAGFYGGPGADSHLGEDKPGQQPLDEMLVEGEQRITPDVTVQMLRSATFLMLRDATGSIVATWDEGRWWTPAESDEFTRQIVAELRAAPRATRRVRPRRSPRR